MAIVNNGTANKLSTNNLPSVYTPPTVVEFTDYEYIKEMVLSVDKVTVHNISPATTMANIISNATIGITKQMLDIVTSDFDPAKTVTFWTDWTNISNNFSQVNGKGAYLTNASAVYQCTVKAYIKSV